jgi:hypothetical protein
LYQILQDDINKDAVFDIVGIFALGSRTIGNKGFPGLVMVWETLLIFSFRFVGGVLEEEMHPLLCFGVNHAVSAPLARRFSATVTEK